MGVGRLSETFGPGRMTYIPPPDPEPGALPRRLVTGLMSRSMSRTNAEVETLLVAGVGGGQVLECDWRSLQPDDGASLNATKLQELIDDLDWCRDRGLGALVRPFAGYFAPDWARKAAGGPAPGGGMVWYTNDGALAVGAPAPSNSKWKMMPRPMPRWWIPGYADAYAEFISKLMAESSLADHPAFCGIVMSGPMTQYAEPFVKQFSLSENRAAAVAAGYSQALDEAAFTSGFLAHAEYCSPHQIATYCSYNDYQFVNNNGGIGNSSDICIRIMEKQVSVLGRMAVVANNSLSFPTTKYPTMYARQKSMRLQTPPVPIHYQTETLIKHEKKWDAQPSGNKQTSPKKTAETAVSWKANAAEMPSGWHVASVVGGVTRWPGISVAEASSLNRRFYNNAVGLDEYHTSPV